MVDQELLVKVSGDLDELKTALDKSKEEVAGLNDAFKTMAEVSAVAFAALTGEAYLSIEAFKKQEQASNDLIQTLQQQGIYSDALAEKYAKQAESVESLTGYDKAQVTQGQALLQSMVGQVEISDDLTKAVVDLAAKKKIDLFSAFNLVGKAATENTEMLKRYGLTIADTGTRSGNLAAITKGLTDAFGGSAEAATQGLGATKLLAATYDDLQKTIGEKLAPAFEVVVKAITSFLGYLKDSPELLDFIVDIGIAAGIITGLATAVGVAGAAFLALSAALSAAGIATGAMTIATQLLVGATGLGLIIIVVAEIYQHWNVIWPAMLGVFRAFVDNIIPLISGLGTLLAGVFTLDPKKISDGLDQIKNAYKKGVDEFQAVRDGANKESEIKAEAHEEKLLAGNKESGAKREAELRRHESLKQQITYDNQQLALAKFNQYNQDVIKAEEEEIKILTALNDDKNKNEFAQLEASLEKVRARKTAALIEQAQEQASLNNDVLKNDKYFQSLSLADQQEFLDKNQQMLRQSILTEKQAKLAVAKDDAELRIKNNNQALKDEQKFGKDYAAINKIMHSEIYTGTKTATGELAALQKSSNATLKGIGQVAAATQIAIKTSESAMNIFAGFSTIPIVGYALGIAGAAAAIAYGAEQEQQVFAAADGGLMTGGIPGRDSIPTLTMPGELVVPTKNFDEVVGAVQDSRSGGSSGGQQSQQEGMAHVVIELKKNFMDIIEMKINERKAIGVSLLRT